ncbi:hypothetical protein BX285_2901 [Streptomyces sp. 1114.5]|uniref:hypothetical protein n=1 Tax=unclassified Streptomyces TaxID=2593676 RepID=UPI000BDDD8E6|nr:MULTISPECIES: hypothetical protein [unclassified Streptomyces]RKT18478.1 hypothetical protein BX285_2901 [Streptomyces sp. 1114.5]SOB84675.1 hypothetical protein SAMN06272789_4932 [Streptomyces sp. 1331.2]
MRGFQRAVLLRAAAAALALGAAVGAHAQVGQALAKRAAERAEREAVACAEAARWDAAERAGGGREDFFELGRQFGCR